MQLYPGPCAYLNSPVDCGTQNVKRASDEDSNSIFSLYFQSGVFFPSAAEIPNTAVVLSYTDYQMRGKCSALDRAPSIFTELAPAAAITHTLGHGKLLLSGVHPEISAAVVAKFKHYDLMHRIRLIDNAVYHLGKSPGSGSATMQHYLDKLSMVTKK